MQLLIWYDDDVTLIYEFETRDQKLEAVLDIIKRRLEMGYFYDDTEDRSRKILDSEDYTEAIRFLDERNDHEYERIQVTQTIDTSK